MSALVWRLLSAAAALLLAALLLRTAGEGLSPAWRLHLEGLALLVVTALLCGRRLAVVTVTVGAVVFSLSLFETLMVQRRPQPSLEFTGAATRLARPDALLGSRSSIDTGELLARKVSADGQPVYSARYGFEQGFRRGHPSAGASTVWFTGCSMTFGEGVNDAETLAQAFGRETGSDTRNFAFPGWGPHQVLRLLETGEAAKHSPAPRLVVYGLMPAHAQRCAGKAFWDFDGPHYQGGATPQFVGSHRQQVTAAKISALLTRLGIVQTQLAQTLLAPFSRPVPADGLLCADLVQAIAGRAKALGAEFWVVYWGSPTSEADIGAGMVEALKAANLTVLPVSTWFDPESPDFQIAGDGHPNAAAQARLSAALAARYREQWP